MQQHAPTRARPALAPACGAHVWRRREAPLPPLPPVPPTSLRRMSASSASWIRRRSAACASTEVTGYSGGKRGRTKGAQRSAALPWPGSWRDNTAYRASQALTESRCRPARPLTASGAQEGPSPVKSGYVAPRGSGLGASGGDTRTCAGVACCSRSALRSSCAGRIGGTQAGVDAILFDGTHEAKRRPTRKQCIGQKNKARQKTPRVMSTSRRAHLLDVDGARRGEEQLQRGLVARRQQLGPEVGEVGSQQVVLELGAPAGSFGGLAGGMFQRFVGQRRGRRAEGQQLRFRRAAHRPEARGKVGRGRRRGVPTQRGPTRSGSGPRPPASRRNRAGGPTAGRTRRATAAAARGPAGRAAAGGRPPRGRGAAAAAGREARG
jgi:hypothetical protein